MNLWNVYFSRINSKNKVPESHSEITQMNKARGKCDSLDENAQTCLQIDTQTQEDENIFSKFMKFFRVVTSVDSCEHTFSSKDACIHKKPMGAVTVKFVERLDFTTSAVILSA